MTRTMASHVNGNPYLNLSRKELQNLCKKYRLPANRSNSHLASSLASYVERVTLLENCPPATLSKESHFRKDGTTNNGLSSGVGAADLDTVEHSGSLAKAFKEVPRPCLEFHVLSDEGIDLSVDLNASPLGWITRFKEEMGLDNVEKIKSQTFREDISCLVENSKEKRSSLVQNVRSNESDDNNAHYCSSSQLSKDDLVASDQMMKGDETLTSALLKPNSIYANLTDNLEENLSSLSAEPSCGESNYLMSAAESCAKDRSGLIFGSGVIGTQLKLTCGSSGNKLLSVQLENSNSKHGGSPSDFMEPQCSEVASYQKVAALQLCENNQSGAGKEILVCSSELNLGINRNQTALIAEASGAGKLQGRESSEFPEFGNSTVMLSFPCLDPKQDPCWKRKHIDYADQYAGGSPDPKFLQRKLVPEIVHPRRSSRLSLKVL